MFRLTHSTCLDQRNDLPQSSITAGLIITSRTSVLVFSVVVLLSDLSNVSWYFFNLSYKGSVCCGIVFVGLKLFSSSAILSENVFFKSHFVWFENARLHQLLSRLEALVFSTMTGSDCSRVFWPDAFRGYCNGDYLICCISHNECSLFVRYPCASSNTGITTLYRTYRCSVWLNIHNIYHLRVICYNDISFCG